MKIEAYTDGSATVQGARKGRGGFGTYFPDLFGKRKAMSLGFENTKTGRMEIMALYFAITSISRKYGQPVVLQVHSDSEYVVKSFTEGRLNRWRSNGWRNSSGEVKNIDLWKAVLSALAKRPFMKLEMYHIKSHQLDKVPAVVRKELLNDRHIVGNAMADRLADYKRHADLLVSDTERIIFKRENY